MNYLAVILLSLLAPIPTMARGVIHQNFESPSRTTIRVEILSKGLNGTLLRVHETILELFPGVTQQTTYPISSHEGTFELAFTIVDSNTGTTIHPKTFRSFAIVPNNEWSVEYDIIDGMPLKFETKYICRDDCGDRVEKDTVTIRRGINYGEIDLAKWLFVSIIVITIVLLLINMKKKNAEYPRLAQKSMNLIRESKIFTIEQGLGQHCHQNQKQENDYTSAPKKFFFANEISCEYAVIDKGSPPQSDFQTNLPIVLSTLV